MYAPLLAPPKLYRNCNTMLIHSDKHTKADLEYWQEYEIVDAINAKKNGLTLKENKALTVLSEFVAKGSCYVGVSWGKDSVTVAHLCYRLGVRIPFVHLYCVPSHNIECDVVRDTFLARYDIPYCEVFVDYGDLYCSNLPDTIQDKETDKIYNATWRRISSRIGVHHISGVRASESGIRRMRMLKHGFDSGLALAPLGWWTEEDIFAYLHKYDLPIHPNYAMLGGGRWRRNRLRVSEIGDGNGNNFGRSEWEGEYYGEELRRMICAKK